MSSFAMTSPKEPFLEKRAENIPKMSEERRKERIAFLMMNKLVVYDKPNPSKRDGGASAESDLEDGRHETEDSEIIIQNQRSGKSRNGQ